MDMLDPAKSIVHCDIHRISYTVGELMKIGQRILHTEVMTHMHVYIVSLKAFKMIEEREQERIGTELTQLSQEMGLYEYKQC